MSDTNPVSRRVLVVALIAVGVASIVGATWWLTSGRDTASPPTDSPSSVAPIEPGTPSTSGPDQPNTPTTATPASPSTYPSGAPDPYQSGEPGSQAQQKVWGPVIVGFAKAFTDVNKDTTEESWVNKVEHCTGDASRVCTSPDLTPLLRTITLEVVPPGTYESYTVDTYGEDEVDATVTYSVEGGEGWKMSIHLAKIGNDWQITSYDQA